MTFICMWVELEQLNVALEFGCLIQCRVVNAAKELILVIWLWLQKYIPQTRQSISCSEFPNGTAFYKQVRSVDMVLILCKIWPQQDYLPHPLPLSQGLDPKAWPIKDLKYNDTGFALQMTRPPCCSDEHVKWCSLPGGRHDLVYSILLPVQL